MIKRIILLVMISILNLSATALAAEPGSGIIEGLVVNGTEGGSSVADQTVILKIYQNDAEIGSPTTKTDAEGHFIFDSLLTEQGYSYEVTLTFQQAEYSGERVSFDEGETTTSVEVTVYDSTTSDEAIKVTMAHSIIYVGEGSLKIMEYFLFINEADRTYIGSKEVTAEGNRETLRFTLPKEATEFQITIGLMECCIMSSGEGFIDTMPVLPGGKELAYSYNVDYNSDTYTFSRNINYLTTRYDLLFQGGVIEVTDTQLTTEEPVDIEDTQFKHLSGSDFAPGDISVVQFSGLPKSDNSSAIIWAALMLVILIIGSGFIYQLRKRKLQPVSSEDSPDQTRQKLLVEIAHLDDDFEGGKIAEEVYRRLRAERKAQLAELIQRPK